MNRKYRKSSWVGKIYKWTKGHHHNTDSCSVKKVVLWEAPIKLLFKQKLFYFSLLDITFHAWFIWHTAIQIYFVANWEWLTTADKNFTLFNLLLAATFPFVALITMIEIFAVIIMVVMGVVSVFKMIGQRIRGKVVTPIENRMRTISAPVENYITEWYGEAKDKLCKPVTWVE